MMPRNVVRRLGMEVLERREVFTTNVAAAIEGGWLVVRGSGGIDAISITRAANGFVEINNIQGKTLINGQNTVRLPGFSGGVRCEMGAGSDFVVLGSGLSVRGPVSMNLGSGDDEFFLGLGGNTRVDGYVTILGEAGHDKASFSPSATYGSGLSFLGDAGNDELLLEGDLTFDGDILFDGGDGIDNFHCVGTLGKTFAPNVSVTRGTGPTTWW